MDLVTLISKGLDENELKCFSCQNYLSYFPISIYQDQSICGRCEPLEGIVCFKNEAFEALCQLFRFPCRYKLEGCREELLPKDVPHHEENCQYRAVPCIIDPTKCKWTGSLSLLSSHCREEHSEVILKTGEFKLDLSVSEEKQHLIQKDDHFLMLNTKFDCENKVLSCALHYDQYRTDCDNRTYQLKIQNEDATLSLNLNATNYKYVGFKNWCLKSVIMSNDSPQISAKISTTKEESVLERRPLPMSEKANQELLLFLTCFKCSKVIRPPFHTCVNKPLCQTCKPVHITECVYCRICETCEIRSDTSFLQKLSELVYYPCQYQKKGCPFSKFKFDQIDSHHSVCEYQNTKCPLKKYHSCKWKGFKKGITNHLLWTHNDIITAGSTFEAVLKPDDFKEKCAIMNVSNVLFLVVYSADLEEVGQDKGEYLWMVLSIDQQDFMYEVEIIDGTNSGRRLLRRKKCLTIFDDGELCFFDFDQVRDFCKDEQLEFKFKIHITK